MTVALASVASTLFLLFLQMYVFAIFFQLILGDDLPEAFGNVASAFKTLLFAGTFLDEVDTAAKQIWEENIGMWFVFLFYIILSSITLVNMLVAVLVEVHTRISAESKDEMCAGTPADAFTKDLTELGLNHNQVLSEEEFGRVVQNGNFVLGLDEVGVDVPSFLEFASMLYLKGIDWSQRENMKTVPLDDFIEMAMNLRCDDPSRVGDIVDWAANKIFKISKSKFKFLRARTYEMIGLVLGCTEAKFCK